MRALQLDAVLDLELFARVSAILAGLSGARIRVGFHRFTQEGLYRGDLMNRPVLYNPYQHIAAAVRHARRRDRVDGRANGKATREPAASAAAAARPAAR